MIEISSSKAQGSHVKNFLILKLNTGFDVETYSTCTQFLCI